MPLRRLLRNYSVALGFALGQLGPPDPERQREPTAIVRLAIDEHAEADIDFACRERVGRNVIITVPLVDDPARRLDPPREPAWVRRN